MIIRNIYNFLYRIRGSLLELRSELDSDVYIPIQFKGMVCLIYLKLQFEPNEG